MAEAPKSGEPGQGRRVALLARPGAACDQLLRALDAAGAHCTLRADPTQLDPPALLEADAQVVLVALDPVTEDALEPFDAVLGDPAIDVIYEDADLAATRDGWDAARWQRHLVAKLRGDGDVLPPGPVQPMPAAATTQDPKTPIPAPTADEPSPTATSDQVVVETDDVRDEVSLPAGTPAATEAPEPMVQRATSFGELTLEDDRDPSPSADEARDRFRDDMSDLEQRISAMELVDDAPARDPQQAGGAVLLLAGLGGPDAVRQLLGALPAGFAHPVLVQQRLDGGRYDKLVAQMQRATALPVKLAEAGQPAQPGTIYILSDAIGVDPVGQVNEAGDDGAQVRFNADGGDVLAALPAADSAVVLLSGSNPDDVDAVMNHGWSGALVAGQAADGCYDAAAPNALAARGGETGTPVELAARLASRWPAGDSGQS